MQQATTDAKTQSTTMQRGFFNLDTGVGEIERGVHIATSGPFSAEYLRQAVKRAETALEIAMLRARIDVHDADVIELFCLLVEHAPEVLPAQWATVADVVLAEERLWVYPPATVGQLEDEGVMAFTPYLDRPKIAAEWHVLLEHARRVHECRHSGQAHGYEC